MGPNILTSRMESKIYEKIEAYRLGVEKTYESGLASYGVTSVKLSFSDFKRNEKCIICTMVVKANGERMERSWNQYVKEKSIDISLENLIECAGSVSDSEASYLKQLSEDRLLIMENEPRLYDVLAKEQALYSLPNIENGGEWLIGDLIHVVEVFESLLSRPPTPRALSRNLVEKPH